MDELIDRFGEPPRQVNNLISVALLRACAAQCRIKDIAQKGGKLVFTLEEFQLEPFSRLCALEKYQKRLVLIPGDIPRFSLALGKGEDALRAAGPWWRPTQTPWRKSDRLYCPRRRFML